MTDIDDDDLFKPLSAKVGRQTYSEGDRPMTDTTARSYEDRKLTNALRKKRAAHIAKVRDVRH
jgi:hypothetical protein